MIRRAGAALTRLCLPYGFSFSRPTNSSMNGLLPRQDLPPRRAEIEIGDAVDLGKALLLARLGRPLHLELIAGKAAEIEVGLQREAVDQLAALLPQRRQRQKRAACDEAGLLVEFALGAGEHVVGFHHALGDRPGALVAAAPIGPAGVGEQQFQPRALAAEGEDAGADFGTAGHFHGLHAGNVPTHSGRLGLTLHHGRAAELVTCSRSGAVMAMPMQWNGSSGCGLCPRWNLAMGSE